MNFSTDADTTKPNWKLKSILRSPFFYVDIKSKIKEAQKASFSVKLGTKLSNNFIERVTKEPNKNDLIEILKWDQDLLKRNLTRTSHKNWKRWNIFGINGRSSQQTWHQKSVNDNITQSSMPHLNATIYGQNMSGGQCRRKTLKRS